MKSKPLWQVAVTTDREAEEAVAALLERLFGAPAAIYSPEGEQTSVATVYSSQPSTQVESKRDALEAGLRFLGTCELKLGASRIVIRKVPREDWTTSWKKHFKTIVIGSALLIKPSWSKRQARKGQAVVTLDPGLSFGTGQHPTTGFCLRQLVNSRRPEQRQSFLDIGTGSGILAIAAAKLGYAPVRALDNDPTSVRVAKLNARNNQVGRKMRIWQDDLTRLPQKSECLYDLICANLTQDLVLSEAARIRQRLEPRGKLVMAGLLTQQFDSVQTLYQGLGFRLETACTQGEWRSGAFIAPT